MDIVTKIERIIKTRDITLEKEGIYNLQLRIEGVSQLGKEPYLHLRLWVMNYCLVYGEDYICEQQHQFSLQNISDIHSRTIKDRLHSLLKHFGVNTFSYELIMPSLVFANPS